MRAGYVCDGEGAGEVEGGGYETIKGINIYEKIYYKLLRKGKRMGLLIILLVLVLVLGSTRVSKKSAKRYIEVALKGDYKVYLNGQEVGPSCIRITDFKEKNIVFDDEKKCVYLFK